MSPAPRALVEDPEDDVTLARVRKVRTADAGTRERWATQIADRLDAPMAALGLIFLLVVLGQTTATSDALQRGLATVGWVLWVVFVGEFLLRLYVAPDRLRFLRQYWWQVVFLVVPVLRFLRLVLVLRVARASRVVSSAVRSSRSAGRLVTSRMSWLAAVSAIVILSSSQLLFAFGVYDEYGDALHGAALATIVGQPMGRHHAFAQVLDVVLAIYSVGVFAAVAGAVGAYFVEGRREAG